MATQVEIIDLTSPKPVVHEIPDSGPDLAEAPAAQPSAAQESRKKKTRRSKRSSLNPSASTPVSRNSRASSRAGDAEPPSPEPRAKRKRRDESPSEESRAQPSNRRARREMEREKAKEQKREDGELDEGELFVVDLTPMPIPSLVIAPTRAADATTGETTAKLLVPAHVTVLGSTPVEIIQPLAESEKDEDFINYLDYDDSKVSIACSGTM